MLNLDGFSSGNTVRIASRFICQHNKDVFLQSIPIKNTYNQNFKVFMQKFQLLFYSLDLQPVLNFSFGFFFKEQYSFQRSSIFRQKEIRNGFHVSCIRLQPFISNFGSEFLQDQNKVFELLVHLFLLFHLSNMFPISSCICYRNYS